MKKLISLLAVFMFVGCSADGDTPDEQRATILSMSEEVVADVEQESPGAKDIIMKAPGYAVFSNAQVNLLIVAAGTGYGVVHDNNTGENTYMDMYEGGVGLGLGAKDFRAVFVFKTQAAMDKFVEDGWAFGGEADAAAKAGDKGGQTSGGVTIGDIIVYQMTESGLALQATLKGTKYVKNDELN
ncbi:hypothetical protein FE810_03085 [Thalassotalea litorea]|uniref:Ysc84 actin-binding domain-containing protein n=1 Tax=Thalassotalea litorea TaxID=2020715 RepID=A0A5R9IS23_9GAMM|nr:YSC84-related protein [Thalassotalea litorea]TLU67283.1 hypothetical protein FE810_03085 [Thalassotalea litorea]